MVLDTLYSPLFDVLCYRCGQLLWGPIGGGHKFTVPRNTDEIRTQTLFGVPPTDLVTSGIFVFRNEMFANYFKYKNAPFPVPPRSPAPSTSRFVVYDTPVLHSATRMYACHVCSKYSAKYDSINYGYTLDGDIHYNIPSKIAHLTQYQKRQIALGALLKYAEARGSSSQAMAPCNWYRWFRPETKPTLQCTLWFHDNERGYFV